MGKYDYAERERERERDVAPLQSTCLFYAKDVLHTYTYLQEEAPAPGPIFMFLDNKEHSVHFYFNGCSWALIDALKPV